MRGRDGAPPAAEPVEGEEAAIAVSGMVNEVGERSEGLATEDIRLLEEILMRWPPPRTTLLVKCLRQKKYFKLFHSFAPHLSLVGKKSFSENPKTRCIDIREMKKVL